MQLLAFAIYSTQSNSKTDLRKVEFQDKFEIETYKTEYAYQNSKKPSTLQFNTKNLKDDEFRLINIFRSIDYNGGLFTFKWNADILPQNFRIVIIGPYMNI